MDTARDHALILKTASLREDYLNQVQRDFLSRLSDSRRINTPSEKKRQVRIIGPNQSNVGVSTPKTLCNLGLVVVYCNSTRFSGKM